MSCKLVLLCVLVSNVCRAGEVAVLFLVVIRRNTWCKLIYLLCSLCTEVPLTASVLGTGILWLDLEAYAIPPIPLQAQCVRWMHASDLSHGKDCENDPNGLCGVTGLGTYIACAAIAV